MNLLSPTLTLTESPIRCRVGMPGWLLVAAAGGTTLAIIALLSSRRRGKGRADMQATLPEKTVESRLREVKCLAEQSLISQAEHEQLRNRILNEI